MAEIYGQRIAALCERLQSDAAGKKKPDLLSKAGLPGDLVSPESWLRG
jgi:hypothetical protein